MKPVKIFPAMLIAVSGLITACSTTSNLANNQDDDVYNSVAKAKEIQYIPYQQSEEYANSDAQYSENGEYDEYYGTSNPYYDMDYSSRINRFYNNGFGSRSYYDPYFNGGYGTTNIYGMNNYYGMGGLYGMNSMFGMGSMYGMNSFGFGLGFGFGSRFGYGLGYNPFYSNMWMSPYYGYGGFGMGYNPYRFGWGPYSMYDRFGYGGMYGGGIYGGGYYGGGRFPIVRNNNPRPGNGQSFNGNNPNYGRPTRGNGQIGNNTGRASNNGRPGSTVYPNSRPTRSGGAPIYNAPTNNRPTRTPSPSYSPSNGGRGSTGSMGGGFGSGGGRSGGGGGGAPSRAGRG